MYNSYLTVIAGPMFSGKSSELIRRLQRYQIAKKKIEVFKPVIDTRYAIDKISSHCGVQFNAVPANGVISGICTDTEVIGLDEVQFFSRPIVDFCLQHALRGIHVIVAGLDLDYKEEPFEVTMRLMALADEVVKLNAVCMSCGRPACRTQRLMAGDERVVIGGSEAYEARCLMCYDPTLSGG